jgi:hypothetical protein
MTKLKTGKYMLLGNPNSLAGPEIRYADTLKGLKLKVWEKDEIKRGTNALFVARDTKIIRVNCNGTKR